MNIQNAPVPTPNAPATEGSTLVMNFQVKVRTSSGLGRFLFIHEREIIPLKNTLEGRWLALPRGTKVTLCAFYEKTDTFMCAVQVPRRDRPGEFEAPEGMILRRMSFDKLNNAAQHPDRIGDIGQVMALDQEDEGDVSIDSDPAPLRDRDIGEAKGSTAAQGGAASEPSNITEDPSDPGLGRSETKSWWQEETKGAL